MTRLPGRLVLLGHPVSHSKSPAFQNAALDAARIPLTYEVIDIEPQAFHEAVAMIRRDRAFGNVTVPHKQRMHDACDLLTPLATRVGAVNTFFFDDDDRLVGDNSDVGGFDLAARMLLGAKPRAMTFGVVGAGGSAAAVLAAVEQWPGCYAHVFNRTPERARLLCERFSAVSQPVDDIGVVAGAQLVVNATTLGLRDEHFPVDPTLLAPGSTVMDLVYRPGETAWVRAARERGHRACDGGRMLVEQGALSFEKWFGVKPDRSRMWEAFSAP